MLEKTEQTANRDLVRFCSQMPEHVLEAAVKIKALWLSAPTDDEDCEYCWSVMNGEEPDVARCGHYERLGEAFGIEKCEVRQRLTSEEEELLHRADRLCHLWEALPEGFYAVPDPRADVDEMTYWRRKDKGKPARPHFEPWPLQARYDPVLYKKDGPDADELRRLTLARRDYVRAWYEVHAEPYRAAIVEAILEDPVAAGRRFADLKTRCCNCGRKLTDEKSKVYGIGPECRKGMSAEILANYYRPAVGRAHAEHDK
jgi:hypothetical protein